MGYRVGSQCFNTLQEANDYKMSLVTPSISQDGTLRLPVRKEDGWYYPVVGINHQSMFIKVELTHPECEPLESFKEGVQVGMILLGYFAIVFLFKLIINMINKSFYEKTGN